MEDRFSVYLSSVEEELPEYLAAYETEDRENFIPILRQAEHSFLRTVLALKKPSHILEIGTGTGFSALFMREYAPAGCRITTIEIYEPRIRRARERFQETEAEEIELLEGDAADLLPSLHGSFDLVFLDSAKGQYPLLLPEIKRLLAPSGVLLADNVLMAGTLLDSRFSLERRDRTTHARMREFLRALKKDPELTTSILPLGDGISFSVKRG